MPPGPPSTSALGSSDEDESLAAAILHCHWQAAAMHMVAMVHVMRIVHVVGAALKSPNGDAS